MTEILGLHGKHPRTPIIDIVFTNGATAQATAIEKRIICSYPLDDVLTEATYDSTSGYLTSANVRCMTKFSRKINKNPIYINFPVESEDDGGYAYDLGFTEDTFTISMTTSEWKEYEKVCTLVKKNVGESPAVVHIGFIRKDPETGEVDPEPSIKKWNEFVTTDSPIYASTGWNSTKYDSYGCHTYKCIIRNSSATMEPGTQMITYDIECTVVYKE